MASSISTPLSDAPTALPEVSINRTNTPWRLGDAPLATASKIPSVANEVIRPPRRSIHVFHRPAPVQTIPIATFYPNNPISWCYFAYQWLHHILFTPREPSVIHQGTWSLSTRSVHIHDSDSMQALWEHGFYGKGSFSRSEPQHQRRQAQSPTLLGLTDDRRDARKSFKWERARAEQDAIWQQKMEEEENGKTTSGGTTGSARRRGPSAPVGPLELLALPNSTRSQTAAEVTAEPTATARVTTQAEKRQESGEIISGAGLTNGSRQNGHTGDDVNGAAHTASPRACVKRAKSVRFSPEVESTTFMLSDPPSPELAQTARRANGADPKGADHKGADRRDAPRTPASPNSVATSRAQKPPSDEHLQLCLEEAFFLHFAMGALSVRDPDTNLPIPTQELFDLCRKYSHFPPRIARGSGLAPDDPFLVQYAAYHHFRSLGWVVRQGVKFGVDWLLYLRGPPFDHAPFTVIVIPATPKSTGLVSVRREGQPTWQRFATWQRVSGRVMKDLVLAYVDVPSVAAFDEARTCGITQAIEQYRVREVLTKRWLPGKQVSDRRGSK